jgi:predicted transcriptional regulator
MEKTTIQLDFKTLERLKLLKVVERQSYDDLVNNLIDNFEEDEILTEEELDEIKLGLEDIKAGRLVSIEQVAKEKGIVLN